MSLRTVLTDSSPPVTWAPRWRQNLALGLSLLGLGISIYLTVVHLGGKALLVCTNNSAFNCEKVQTSAWSHFLGLPVAELGLAYYVAMLAVNLPWAWRSTDRRVHLARLVLAVLGMVFALRLVYAELIWIKSICLWCTGVHLVTFALLVLFAATIPTMLGWGVPAGEPE